MILRNVSLASAALLLLVGSAAAAPLTPTPLVDQGQDGAQIVQVAEGCGFGEHRGPYGGCRLNNGPRGVIREELTGAPRGCPPGMHRGPYGHCHY